MSMICVFSFPEEDRITLNNGETDEVSLFSTSSRFAAGYMYQMDGVARRNCFHMLHVSAH